MLLRSKHTPDVLFLTGVISALIVIWFRLGLTMATGESGLPYYDPAFFLKGSGYAWNNEVLGESFHTEASSFPFYLLLAFPSSLGIPASRTKPEPSESSRRPLHYRSTDSRFWLLGYSTTKNRKSRPNGRSATAISHNLPGRA